MTRNYRMSVFLENKSNEDNGNGNGEGEGEVAVKKDNSFIEYYRRVLPGCDPVAIYKNTKFLSVDKINGGLLSDDEKLEYESKNSPSGYRFNLYGSGYFVIDVDVDEIFKAKSCVDWKEEAQYLTELETMPESIEIKEIRLNNKMKKIRSSNRANIIFSNLFKTPYVSTPSGGFHFYFKNDLSLEQVKDIFGILRYRYIKVINLFDIIDIDIFLDLNSDDATKDGYLVLPFSKIIKEVDNKIDIEANKTEILEYSGLRYPNVKGVYCDDFRKASELIEWLKKRVTKMENRFNYEYQPENKTKYEERGRAIDVHEIDIDAYLKQFKSDMKIIARNMGEISTYASRPFNLYQLMTVLVFFPIKMHLDLLSIFVDILIGRLSDNAKKQLLSYYYHLVSDNEKIKDLKNPRYMEAIMNNNFGTTIDNRWSFIYENDDRKQNSEETIEDEDNDIKKIVENIAKKYNLKSPLN